ncbi:MAG: cytochrome c [Proteobacteria bacterium]|nr:cytochrome c [Pseudomonadota bacterium]
MTLHPKRGQAIHDAHLRENPEPHESSTPIPVLLLGLVAILLGWAVYYIATANPRTPPQFGDRRTLSDLSATVAAAPGAAVDGAQIFSAQCSACHQATGQGIPGVFPPLAGSEWATGKERLIVQILLHGIDGPITVKGANYQGAMPNFGEKLNDAEIAAVTSYVRKQWGNTASPISPATVATERDATKARSKPWTGGDELAQFR